MTSNAIHLWPPVGSGLPEPLASCLHAYVIADLSVVTLTRGARTNGLLDPAARWPDLLREQITRAARDENELRQRLLDHFRRIAFAGRWAPDDAVATADTVTSVLIYLAAHFGAPDPLDTTDSKELADADYLSRWAALQPPGPPASHTTADASDLLGLRLAMGELEAIEEVVGNAGGGRLGVFAKAPMGSAATERTALTLDLDRLATAYPHLDPERLALHVEMALWKRHLFGVLGLQDLDALDIVAADHPCGIDVNAGSSRQSLERGGWALTGNDVSSTLILEWGRHEFFNFGEDEDLLFFEQDRRALEAAMADPLCVKADYIDGVVEFKLR